MVENPGVGPFSMRSQVPERRFELYMGKFSLADFMDSCCGADPHFGLLNWGSNSNLAWDYGADTRGYDYAIMAEYLDPLFAVRFVEGLEPTVANGLDLDWRFDRDHCENLELEVHGNIIDDWRGKLSLLGFFNHAHMGSYEDSLRLFFSGQGDASVPDITQTERPRNRARTKYGLIVEAEQEITKMFRVFAGFGINDDKNESWAYAECANSAQVGFDVRGDLWDRERDRFGAAFISSGIDSAHRRYLEYGGIGTLELGDGGLSYQRETVVETYYTIKLPFGLSFGPLYQHIWNPGYNHDRGPIDVYGFRVHLEI
jgi:high affinity Mn2+ porin